MILCTLFPSNHNTSSFPISPNVKHIIIPQNQIHMLCPQETVPDSYHQTSLEVLPFLLSPCIQLYDNIFEGVMSKYFLTELFSFKLYNIEQYFVHNSFPISVK